jgi:flavin reductase (DIM6/NTAB) family NADH-FMN oxidoreductase RutF
MTRHAIPVEELIISPSKLWLSRWLLLAAGDFESGDFNAMTVGWGTFGAMWNRPVAQVVVRPVRHTYGFMERYGAFTLSAFSEERRKALSLMGSKSGRDGDKIAEAGLTPIASTKVAAPGFAEAELIVECRTIYWHDFDPARFIEPAIEKNYPDKDYHRSYLGEILAVHGTDLWKRS